MAHEPKQGSKQPPKLVLPTLVVSPADIGRLKRELESLGDYLQQARIRASDSGLKLPKTSRLLDELTASNKLNLLQAADRDQALAFLSQLQTTAPVVTMSFATDPSSAFLVKIIAWLRQNVHPELLLRTGLQPSIAAGCTLRTTNHYYDFSLRQRFSDQRALLLNKLHGTATAEPKSE